MKTRLAAVAAVILMLTAAQAQAGACYGAREVEAEQGLRIHSELMVIGLTCLKMPGGQDLYRKYAQFTNANQSLIAGYEETLIDYYRAHGAGSSSEQKLHTLRTNLANAIAVHTVEMGTLSFCDHFAARLDKALAMDQDTLRRWAQHTWPDTPVSQPICASTASASR
jgi:hypothetical protein